MATNNSKSSTPRVGANPDFAAVLAAARGAEVTLEAARTRGEMKFNPIGEWRYRGEVPRMYGMRLVVQFDHLDRMIVGLSGPGDVGAFYMAVPNNELAELARRLGNALGEEARRRQQGGEVNWKPWA